MGAGKLNLVVAALLVGCSGGAPKHPVVVTPQLHASVFQAWNGIVNRPDLSEDEKLAKHDVAWLPVVWTGYNWSGNYRSETLTRTPRSVLRLRALLPKAVHHRAAALGGPLYDVAHVRQLKPSIKILIEIHHRDTLDGDLPESDPWWLRDQSGQRIVSWQGEGATAYRLDQDNAALQDHVAARARAVMAAGSFDGVMLDWFEPETAALNAIATKVRDATGPSAIIIVNANTKRLSAALLQKVNGVFMENGALDGPSLGNAIAVLAYNEANARPPRHNCLENWRTSTDVKDAKDLARMQATTDAVMNQSGAHVLFSHPNQGFGFPPEPDHLHEWYDYWNR